MNRYCIGGHVVRFDQGRTVTTLVDGCTVHAVPHDTNSYRATAEHLGYGSDTLAMSQDHELTHCLLATWLGLPESPVMRAVADGSWQYGPATLGLEEDAVLAIQRLVCSLGLSLPGLAGPQS